jgi:hypothetical protein
MWKMHENKITKMWFIAMSTLVSQLSILSMLFGG